MAGYGDDSAFAAWLAGQGFTLPSGAPTAAVLRQRVTSKGGTTYAALQSMEADGVGAAFERAMQAACQRADELGNEFGA